MPSQFETASIFAISLGMRNCFKYLVIISAVLVYTAKHVYAVDRCEHIFAEPHAVIDSRYGTMDQMQKLFFSKGLFSSQGSMLCGPTSVYNALIKLRQGGRSTQVQKLDPQGVIDILVKADELFPITKEDIVNRGLVDTELAETIRVILKEEKIPARVRLIVTPDKVEGAESVVKLSDLRKATVNQSAAIVLTQTYETKDAVQANEYNFMHGHFLLVVGYDSSNPRRFFFNDPMRPKEVRAAILEPVSPDSYNAPTYKVKFEDSPDLENSLLISSVILVDVLTSAGGRP